MKKLLSFFCVLLFCLTAQAQTNTWAGQVLMTSTNTANLQNGILSGNGGLDLGSTVIAGTGQILLTNTGSPAIDYLISPGNFGGEAWQVSGNFVWTELAGSNWWSLAGQQSPNALTFISCTNGQILLGAPLVDTNSFGYTVPGGFTNGPTTGYAVTFNTFYTNTFGCKITAYLLFTNSAVIGESQVYYWKPGGTPFPGAGVAIGATTFTATTSENMVSINLDPGGYLAYSNAVAAVNVKTNAVQLWNQ